MQYVPTDEVLGIFYFLTPYVFWKFVVHFSCLKDFVWLLFLICPVMLMYRALHLSSHADVHSFTFVQSC